MMRPRPRQSRPGPAATADRLHSAAIHLLRALRVEDAGSGLTAPRLSALSVIVFAGPLTMSALAAAEQVKPPTMTKVVRDLEGAGLVVRERDPGDHRVQRVSATVMGRALLQEGRRRRVARLARAVAALPLREQRLLATAAELIDHLARPRAPA